MPRTPLKKLGDKLPNETPSKSSSSSSSKTPAKNGKRRDSTFSKSTPSASASGTIPAFFAKQRLTNVSSPKTITCPVCSAIVLLSGINAHLDAGCASSSSAESNGPVCDGGRGKGEGGGGGGGDGVVAKNVGEIDEARVAVEADAKGGGVANGRRRENESRRDSGVETKGKDSDVENDAENDGRNDDRRSKGEASEIRPTPTKLKRKIASVSAVAGMSPCRKRLRVSSLGKDDGDAEGTPDLDASSLLRATEATTTTTTTTTVPGETSRKNSEGKETEEGFENDARSGINPFATPTKKNKRPDVNVPVWREMRPSFSSPSKVARSPVSSKEDSGVAKTVSSPDRCLLAALKRHDAVEGDDIDGRDAVSSSAIRGGKEGEGYPQNPGVNRLARDYLNSPVDSSKREKMKDTAKTPDKLLQVPPYGRPKDGCSTGRPPDAFAPLKSPGVSSVSQPSFPPKGSTTPSARASPLKIAPLPPGSSFSPVSPRASPLKLNSIRLPSQMKSSPSNAFARAAPSSPRRPFGGSQGSRRDQSSPPRQGTTRPLASPVRPSGTSNSPLTSPTHPLASPIRPFTSPSRAGTATPGRRFTPAHSPPSSQRGTPTSSPLHDPNRYWNRRRVAVGNEDAVVGVARKLWGGENEDERRAEEQEAAAEKTTSATQSQAKQIWKPYYLENFLLILKATRSNRNDWRLFSSLDRMWFCHFLQDCADDADADLVDDEERKLFDVDGDPEGRRTLDAHRSSPRLSEEAQLLFVRLFQRKHRWLRRDQIKYEAIADDLGGALSELVSAGFLLSSDRESFSLDDITEVLDLLLAPELKTLAKSLRVDLPKNVKTATTKPDLIRALLQHGSRQKSILDFTRLKSDDNRSDSSPSTSSSTTTGSSKLLLAKAKALLGTAFRVSDEPREVFLRAILLFDMCGFWMDVLQDSNSSQGGSNELFKILLVNTGKLIYPSYVVDRRTMIFRHRQDLIDWQNAVVIEKELRTAIDASQWDDAFCFFERRREWCQQFLEDGEMSRRAGSLPTFLRRYTPGWSAIKILSYGVDVLERRKDFSAAVDLLNILLAQRVFCPGSRGKWFDRLTLNLHHHLRLPEKAWTRCLEGLKDDDVKAGRKLSLWMRVEKLAGDKREKRFDLGDIPETLRQHSRRAPERRIEGTLVPGMTGVYLSHASSNTPSSSPANTPSKRNLSTPPKLAERGFEAVRVEELTLRYYKENQGFAQGLHCEGSVFSALFLLLFWDVIFMPGIGDVFWNPFQTMPLDFLTPDFYSNRKEETDERLEWISHASLADLIGVIRTIWEKHEGTMVTGISWERFETVEFLVGFLESMDSGAGYCLSVICRRLARDYRHTRSGMPDLCLWSREEKKWMLVEVKGPNDKLSTKQMMWLDYFVRMGIPCEVCHVTAISSKKLKAGKGKSNSTKASSTPNEAGITPSKTRGTPKKSNATPMKAGVSPKRASTKKTRKDSNIASEDTP